MANFMNSAIIKFLGSDYAPVQESFTVGRDYLTDCSSAGNFMVVDDNGDDWVIESDDNDFKVIAYGKESV